MQLKLAKDEITRMSSPVLSFTMDELAEGHRKYGHNFQELINQHTDRPEEKCGRNVEKDIMLKT